MPRSSGQKLKLLYLADIFRNETDEQNPISLKEIIARLDAYGISAERKSIYGDIELLRDSYNMDICTVREGGMTRYFLGTGEFQFAELQLLADAVACSKFITESKSRELIAKLGTLTSRHQAQALSRSVIVANRVKTINERIYYNIQAIHEGIKAGRKISFLYFGFDPGKHKYYKREGSRYAMSPYSLAWEDENYYCVGFYEARGEIANFRVDRMEDIQLTSEPATTDDTFSIAEYSRRVFGMFRGETVHAKLLFDNSLVSVVMDKFGSDVVMHKADENHFFISRDISVSPTFFGWIFQFGSKAKILGPDSLIEAMRKHIADFCAQMDGEQ